MTYEVAVESEVLLTPVAWESLKATIDRYGFARVWAGSQWVIIRLEKTDA